jgi:AraC-like DNA-binding protein
MGLPPFRYTTLSDQDKFLSLYLTVAGVSDISAGSEFPPKQGHPSRYRFKMENGRILQEYQMIYVIDGYGVYQNRHKTYRITPGTMIILFPGEWHRYRPLKSTGWRSHFVGFNGDIVKELLNPTYISPENPIIHLGLNSEIIDYFNKIQNLLIHDKPDSHKICVGLFIAYICQVIALLKYKEFEGTEIEIKIKNACFLLNERVNQELDAKKLAEDLNMGYSNFRRLFTKYTGLPPLQYHTQLRIRRAEILLSTTNMPIKEISAELGFESSYYFSRIFKEKTKITPAKYRNSNLGN